MCIFKHTGKRPAAGSPLWLPPSPSCAMQNLRGSVREKDSVADWWVRVRSSCFQLVQGWSAAVMAVVCIPALAGEAAGDAVEVVEAVWVWGKWKNENRAWLARLVRLLARLFGFEKMEK